MADRQSVRTFVTSSPTRRPGSPHRARANVPTTVATVGNGIVLTIRMLTATVTPAVTARPGENNSMIIKGTLGRRQRQPDEDVGSLDEREARQPPGSGQDEPDAHHDTEHRMDAQRSPVQRHRRHDAEGEEIGEAVEVGPEGTVAASAPRHGAVE